VVTEPLYPLPQNNRAAQSQAYQRTRARYAADYGLYEALQEPIARGRYLVDGYFEYCGFYNSREALIKSFFNLEPVEKNTRDLVMNVRLEDFANMGMIIEPGWYLDILEAERFDRLYITGVAPGEKYLKPFMKYDPVIIPPDPVNNFHFIRSFDKIISSNSTYCWWAAFLSEAKRIYISDKWISPLLTSCKDSILVEADYARTYQPVTSYGSPNHLVHFSRRLKMLLDNYPVPSDARMNKIVENCICSVFNALDKTQPEGKLALTLSTQTNGAYSLVLEPGRYTIKRGTVPDPDCRIDFPEWRSLINALTIKDAFQEGIASQAIRLSGDATHLLGRLDEKTLAAGLETALDGFVQKVSFPTYAETENTSREMAALLSQGATVCWFAHLEDDGLELEGDLGCLVFMHRNQRIKGVAHLLADPVARALAEANFEPVEGFRMPSLFTLDDGRGAVGEAGPYAALLGHLKDLTGRRAVLAATYDVAGGVVTANLHELMQTFYASDLDYLVFDGVVVKNQQKTPLNPLTVHEKKQIKNPPGAAALAGSR
jgi:hypothetical protein